MLRDLLQEHLGARPGSTSSGRWGNGSRIGSLVGSALLTPLTPEDAGLDAFTAWIVTAAPEEGLVLPTPFVPPTSSDTFEAVCWLPYPGTRAYLALQNISGSSLDLTLKSPNDYKQGKSDDGETHHLHPFAWRLLDITTLLQPSGEALDRGAVGEIHAGIRLTCKTEDAPAQGSVVGRGLLIDQQHGFSSPFVIQEPIGNVPRDAITEIHAPLLLFGRLDSLLSGSTAQMHPHLLMRNISFTLVTTQATIWGKSANGNVAQWALQPIMLAPRHVEHIDLEEERRVSGSVIVDGVAGLRLMHDGAPTDVIVELVNVDETGDVVMYDRVRNLFFHESTMQVAISFSLSEGGQTLLSLKNVTDQAQGARVVLDYYDGKAQYHVNVAAIEPQQTTVIDIGQLRDDRVPDRNGSILPADVTFGGAVIFSEPGAFVAADPTFLFRTSEGSREREVLAVIEETWGGPSCVGEGGGGRPDPDPGPPMDPPFHQYQGNPFRPEDGPCFIFQRCGGTHKAVDIGVAGATAGVTTVLAMEDGVVTDVEGSKQPGDETANAVIVQDQFGVITIYSHVTPRPGLGRGQTVGQGDVIGTVDESGHSEGGPHVHIVRLRPGPNTYQDTVNRVKNGEGLCNFTLPCRSLFKPPGKTF
jgi:murein DD-endopeptidase MepM/ murein hydrolase activator NlpD